MSSHRHLLLLLALFGILGLTENFINLIRPSQQIRATSVYEPDRIEFIQNQSDANSSQLLQQQVEEQGGVAEQQQQQQFLYEPQQPQQRTIQFQGPNEYLIEQAQTRATTIAEFRPTPHEIRLAKSHPAFARIPIKKHWQRTHFPDINIIGLPKAGTSHLYQLLARHSEVRPFNSNKEWCFHSLHKQLARMNLPDGGGAAYNVTTWSNMTYDDRLRAALRNVNLSKKGWPRETPENNTQTVNACFNLNSVLKQRNYLKRNDAKYILLLRDPADWLWAAYNFWHRPEHEDVNRPAVSDWASAPRQYRSPELFHEYMLSGGRTWSAQVLLSVFRNGMAAWTPPMLWQTIGPPNVLVLKSEDFAPGVVLENGVLDKLATFLQISPTGFDPNITNSYGNCGDKKGVNSLCKEASNAYRTSGGRGMFNETRDLVYVQFAEECKYWAETFNIVYEGCIDVARKYLKPVNEKVLRNNRRKEFKNRKKSSETLRREGIGGTAAAFG
jgi:hypothetical protein